MGLVALKRFEVFRWSHLSHTQQLQTLDLLKRVKNPFVVAILRQNPERLVLVDNENSSRPISAIEYNRNGDVFHVHRLASEPRSTVHGLDGRSPAEELCIHFFHSFENIPQPEVTSVGFSEKGSAFLDGLCRKYGVTGLEPALKIRSLMDVLRKQAPVAGATWRLPE